MPKTPPIEIQISMKVHATPEELAEAAFNEYWSPKNASEPVKWEEADALSKADWIDVANAVMARLGLQLKETTNATGMGQNDRQDTKAEGGYQSNPVGSQGPGC